MRLVKKNAQKFAEKNAEIIGNYKKILNLRNLRLYPFIRTPKDGVDMTWISRKRTAGLIHPTRIRRRTEGADLN